MMVSSAWHFGVHYSLPAGFGSIRHFPLKSFLSPTTGVEKLPLSLGLSVLPFTAGIRDAPLFLVHLFILKWDLDA